MKITDIINESLEQAAKGNYTAGKNLSAPDATATNAAGDAAKSAMDAWNKLPDGSKNQTTREAFIKKTINAMAHLTTTERRNALRSNILKLNVTGKAGDGSSGSGIDSTKHQQKQATSNNKDVADSAHKAAQAREDKMHAKDSNNKASAKAMDARKDKAAATEKPSLTDLARKSSKYSKNTRNIENNKSIK